MRRSIVCSLVFLSLLVATPSIFMAQAYGKEQKALEGLYTCPMHPDYVADKPGACPICGMDLVKKKVARPSMPTDAPGPAQVVESLHISRDQQEQIGLRTEKIAVRALALEIRASGRVVLDQELFDAQASFLGSNLLTTQYFNPQRQKLFLLGMSEDEIARIKQARRPDRSLVQLGFSDNIWVYASVFENEIALIKGGQSVDVAAVAFPGEVFSAMVLGVAQEIDPQTRTARVRIKVADKDKKLRPEMSVAASIKVDMGQKLAVPADAVMDSGRRKIVHVMTGSESFVPYEVTLGRQAGGYVEVLEGLKSGDQVVVSGNFLLDSESRLKGIEPVRVTGKSGSL